MRCEGKRQPQVLLTLCVFAVNVSGYVIILSASVTGEV
jgi:hypothetical protein